MRRVLEKERNGSEVQGWRARKESGDEASRQWDDWIIRGLVVSEMMVEERRVEGSNASQPLTSTPARCKIGLPHRRTPALEPTNF